MGKQSFRKDVAEAALRLGVELKPDWSGIDSLLPVLERVRLQGVVVVMRMGGASDERPYSVLFSGGALGREVLRMNSHSMEDAVGWAVVNFARRA